MEGETFRKGAKRPADAVVLVVKTAKIVTGEIGDTPEVDGKYKAAPATGKEGGTARGHDADWFREALKNNGIKPGIPGRKPCGKPIKYDMRRYKCRNRIKILFGRLRGWRRVATRCDRRPKAFLSAIALAATVMFWL